MAKDGKINYEKILDGCCLGTARVQLNLEALLKYE